MQAKSGLNTLTLELLRKCPNQCLHCSTLSSPKATDFISLEESKRIIEEAKELGLKKIILSGGEPLIYNELIPLLSFLKSKNLEVVIYTSGSILDSSNCIDFAPKALLEQISKLGVVRYNLSIHSSNCDSHDSFMNTQGSWEKSIQFLEFCKDLKQVVHIHTVLSSFNFDNIIELSTFLAKKGVSVLRILKLVPQGRALKNYEKLKTNDIQESIFWGQVKKINEEKLIELKLGAHLYSLSNNTEYVCSLDSEKMTITPDGTFSVCPAFKGLSKILNSPKIGSENISSVVSSDWRNKISNYKTEFKHTCPAQELYENLTNKKKTSQ